VNIVYAGPRDFLRVTPNSPTIVPLLAEIRKDIAGELQAGRVAGPYSSPPFPHFVSSPLGAVPKPDGSWRIIHNLSAPLDSSINSHVLHIPVTLTAFDRFCNLAARQGLGGFLYKVDIAKAYKAIPVRPFDWPLLGFALDGLFFYDKTLPMGLSSSAALFEKFSGATEWIVKKVLGLSDVEHYLDDFVGAAESLERAQEQLSTLIHLLEFLGWPVNPQKTVPPSQIVKVLGIVFDTIKMTLSVGTQRLADIVTRATELLERRVASRYELQSIIGVLSFASKVIRPGRAFIRRLIDACKAAPADDSRASLSDDAVADLRFWSVLAAEWDGVSPILPIAWPDDGDNCCTSDASLLGFGVLHGTDWISQSWTPAELERGHTLASKDMPFLELFALVCGAASFGHRWRGRNITFLTDCAALIPIISSLSCRDPQMMQLIRALVFVASQCGFDFRTQHIAGASNTLADALSRLQIDRFRQAFPSANPSPTAPVPPPVRAW